MREIMIEHEKKKLKLFEDDLIRHNTAEGEETVYK